MNHDMITLLLLWYADSELQVTPASPLPWLWLGAHEAWWAWEGCARGPLLVEAFRLWERWSTRARRRGEVPRYKPRPATVPVYLDSGAFSQLDRFGRFILSAKDYVEHVRRTMAELGTVRHVGVQDWMCEAHILKKTGLSVAEHQRRSVASFLELRELAPEVPWVATLQGHTGADYIECGEMFRRAGVDLASEALVGLGSVCRRSGTAELVEVIDVVTAALPGVNLHGYGVKHEGAVLSCLNLRSIDSAAGSRRGRGIGTDLRGAVGLPADAPWSALASAMAERGDTVDLELLEMFEWMRDTGITTGLQNSPVWGEVWRAQQQCKIAAAVAERAALPLAA